MLRRSYGSIGEETGKSSLIWLVPHTKPRQFLPIFGPFETILGTRWPKIWRFAGPLPEATPTESDRRILPGFCRIQSDSVRFGLIQSDSVGFGQIWSDLVGFGRILISGKFGRNWSELVGIGRRRLSFYNLTYYYLNKVHSTDSRTKKHLENPGRNKILAKNP